ncbi:unnamed protein product [Ambrosiozyma monospora]|uniref:Unnamed protein product n=1 Tax=Ambrosiozyma monospora TaxID=43982 RepID=A0ACB5T8W5_AMBMO|nr:unnamed protein product [Ambrosiozyma monospora]
MHKSIIMTTSTSYSSYSSHSSHSRASRAFSSRHQPPPRACPRKNRRLCQLLKKTYVLLKLYLECTIDRLLYVDGKNKLKTVLYCKDNRYLLPTKTQWEQNLNLAVSLNGTFDQDETIMIQPKSCYEVS